MGKGKVLVVFSMNMYNLEDKEKNERRKGTEGNERK